MGQIVEITNPGVILKKHRGFLEVHLEGHLSGKVVLDDIELVIISNPGALISSTLIDQLAQRNIPLAICGQNYMPSSWILPVREHSRQYQIMQAQVSLSVPMRKRFWQRIVKAKIRNQADVLRRANLPVTDLEMLEKKVRSGDSDNCEAIAAKAYWKRVFGDNFFRSRNAGGLNAALNYGYAILRACAARGVIGAGLHPSFSIHHKSSQNPMNLVDDLIEPFRPIVDLLIFNQVDLYRSHLTTESKKGLAKLPNLLLPSFSDTSKKGSRKNNRTPALPMSDADSRSPLSLVAANLCRSFAQYCLHEEAKIAMPGLPNGADI